MLSQDALVSAFYTLGQKYNVDKRKLSSATASQIQSTLNAWQDFYYNTNKEAALSGDDLMHWNQVYTKAAQLLLASTKPKPKPKPHKAVKGKTAPASPPSPAVFAVKPPVTLNIDMAKMAKAGMGILGAGMLALAVMAGKGMKSS